MVQHRRSRAAVAVRTAVRCAIYTRKSTEKGLDRDFTSLDNQRQTCERFLEHMEGAVLVPTRYDDGGYSGGTTDRPGLQQLIADIKAREIDCVVAYKYDRLGRSMIDCLRMFELFDKYSVRFISVTQQIDTSTSHGRMFVNNLLSFAQYERDVISERTRDKMQAARRRGQWTGGMPPLGYDVAPEGGRLVVNREEAEVVKAIFALYAETPSLVKVSQELNRRGWRTKSWTTKTGNRREGGQWNRVTLQRLLKNPVVVGKIRLGDEVFSGEHPAIVPRRLFDEVQRLMKTNRSTGGSSARNRYGALLRGLLRCTACDAAMTFFPTRRGTRLYKYYRCSAAEKRGAATCPTGSLNADKVETFVVDTIRRIGANPELQQETFRQAVAQVKAARRGLKAEKKRLERDLVPARQAVSGLVATLADAQGRTREAVAGELDKAQDHVRALETRVAEIQVKLARLDPAAVDEAELARALEAFDPIWEVLLTREKERMLHLLIERIDYDGRNLKIHWRLAGLGQYVAEVNGGGQ